MLQIFKYLRGNDRQKCLDHAKISSTDQLQTSSKKLIQKTAEAAGDFIGNKVANKITRISKDSQQNNSETVTNEYDKEIPKEDIFLQNKGKKLLMN